MFFTVEGLTDKRVKVATTFMAPLAAGNYRNTWQLNDIEKNLLGTPITFEVQTVSEGTTPVVGPETEPEEPAPTVITPENVITSTVPITP